MFHTADEFAAKMTTPVILLCFFLAFCPLSVGTPLTCPPPFLNESPQQGSGKLCVTLQLQTKLPCPGVNLSVSENVPLNPEQWHLESLSLKVEKSCSFMVFTQDQQSQHFPGGFYANIPINYKSEFLCICTKLHIRHRRTPTFNNFYLKHIIDGKNIPTDNNAYDRFWSKTFDNALKARNQYVPKQTFIPNNSFKQGFKINKDFKIKFSNQKILYRSENKMDMYDVTKRNGQVNVVKRIDYPVFDVNDEDQPIHFEPVPEEFSEPLGKMKPQQPLSIKSKPGSGWRAGLQKWGEVVEEVAEAENLATAVIVTSTLTQASIFTSIMSSLAFLFV